MQQGRESYLLPMVLIICLFFLWGVANHLNDILIPHFKKAFLLSDLQSGLIQSAFYMGYFLLALPAGFLMRRFGYKAAVLTGLILFGTGALLFYPAAEIREYALFLAALFVIASGLAFLETSANPLMTVLGDPATAERRLNFAQAFNPLGAISAVLLGRQFILSGVEPTAEEFAQMTPAQLAAFQTTEAHAVQMPYLIIAAVVFGWAVLVALTRFPAAARRPADADHTAHAPVRGLFAHSRFLFGVIAQFFYVGAQVGVWSFTIRYAQHEMPGMGEKTAAAYLTGSLIAFMVGRFVGTALMGKVDPARLMGIYALCNVGLMAIAVVAGGHIGLLALAATSFFMSIMFPTIFANALRGLKDLTQIGASILVMSIIGGAVLTALMGFISDQSSIRFAMLVPGVAFVVVALFGLSGRAGSRVAVAQPASP